MLCLALPLIVPPPAGLPEPAWRAAGLALLMALWWLTEALPLAATALVPLALAPLLGLAGLDTVAPAYSHPLVVLFLGGFLLARAIERWGLHRRVAFALLGLAGDRPGRVLAAMMAATAFLSLWISNTAAAMVMAPIAAGIADTQARAGRFPAALMLGVAFSATIGGMGTLIGTPPNAIFAAYMSRAHGIEIGFARWAMAALPVAAVLLVAAWAVLARVTPGLGEGRLAPRQDAAPGPMGPAERRVALLAGLTALAWIARPLLNGLFPGLGLSDAGIAVLAALALFVLPSGQGGRLLDWSHAATLRWDVLILFGGGLALAGLLEGSGLAGWIGQRAATLQGLSLPLLIAVMAALIVLVGELASNTAMASIFLPIAGAAALTLGADPVAFLLPVALAASLGFMLPVATPPNAIVFGHKAVGRADMLRAGALLDLIGIAVAVAGGVLLGPYLG
nr:DASS family sodium-coupled anion symporter [Actibacterium sp. MT2.3-13A]